MRFITKFSVGDSVCFLSDNQIMVGDITLIKVTIDKNFIQKVRYMVLVSSDGVCDVHEKKQYEVFKNADLLCDWLKGGVNNEKKTDKK